MTRLNHNALTGFLGLCRDRAQCPTLQYRCNLQVTMDLFLKCVLQAINTKFHIFKYTSWRTCQPMLWPLELEMSSFHHYLPPFILLLMAIIIVIPGQNGCTQWKILHTVLSRIYTLSSVKFIGLKLRLRKKMTNIRYAHGHHHNLVPGQNGCSQFLTGQSVISIPDQW